MVGMANGSRCGGGRKQELRKIIPTSATKIHDDETVADKIPRAAANFMEEAVGHFDRAIALCLRACVVDVGRAYRFLVGAGLRLFASPALIPVVFLRLEAKPIGFLPHVQACMILSLDFNSD